MESLLAHLARKERGRLDVKRIDVEKRPDAAAKMKVEVVPTLLLIKEKRVVGRLEGRVSAPKIEQMIEPHLAEQIAGLSSFQALDHGEPELRRAGAVDRPGGRT